MRLLIALTISSAFLSHIARADGPTTQSAPALIFNGKIEYIPPTAWNLQKASADPETVAIYLAADEDGYFALQVLPGNAAINSDAAQSILAQLRKIHKMKKQELVQAPTLEKDSRFAIKIHERYKTREGKTADETHLYRQVSGRVLELDVQSLSQDEIHLAEVRKVGEDVLLSAHFKKPPKPKRAN